MDDRALIAAALDGDREAFGQLVDRETTTVYRAALRILREARDAEDVAQETFVTAYRSLGGFRGDGPLRAWLVRIATRLAFRRLAQRRPGEAIDGISAERLGSHADDPARIAVVAERAADLRDAVAGLVEPYREVVALRFFGELSLAEIAETTGRPLNTVKTHLRRGLERLRPVIGQVDG